MTRKFLTFIAGAVALGILTMCLPPSFSSTLAADTPLLDDFATRSQMSGNPGTAVWRMDLDLDGDGKAEILLSNRETVTKHGEAEWEVYKYVSGPQYRFVGSLIFSHASFQLLQSPARIEALWFGDAHEENAAGDIQRSADLITYQVGQTGITLSSTTPLQEADIEKKVAQMDAWRNVAKPHVLVAVADANGIFENPTWNDLDTGKPAPGVTSLEELVIVQ